jgi:hypothetical protein
MVDVLKGPQFDVRVEADNGTIKPEIFTIKVMFMTPERSSYFFEPSLSFVTLPNGQRLNAKGFPCSYTIYSLDNFRSGTPISGSIRLREPPHRGIRYGCFILFFDAHPPSIEEEFSLRLTGLKTDTDMVEIPTISFFKGER